MSKTDDAARLARLNVARHVQEKLMVLNDPEIVDYLDAMDRIYANEILSKAIEPNEKARVAAFRREALHTIRGMITGSTDRLKRIAEQEMKLTKKADDES